MKVAGDGLAILQETNCAPADIAEAYKQLGATLFTQGEYDRAEQNLHAGLALKKFSLENFLSTSSG